jgi:hypothetical protein
MGLAGDCRIGAVLSGPMGTGHKKARRGNAAIWFHPVRISKFPSPLTHIKNALYGAS